MNRQTCIDLRHVAPAHIGWREKGCSAYYPFRTGPSLRGLRIPPTHVHFQNGRHDDCGTVCILLHECRPGWGTGQNRLLRGTGLDAFSYQPGNQGFLQEASQGMVRFYEGQLSPVCRSVGHLQTCLKCLLCFCVRLGIVY